MPREYTVNRPQDVALVFEGDLLAAQSSAYPGAQRWLETNIYRTTSGRYVTEMIGKTRVQGELDKVTVNVYDNPADVRLGFLRTRHSGPHKGQQYLTVQAEETIRAAADLDPALNDALVERI
jgi:ribosomal protein S28E/S33